MTVSHKIYDAWRVSPPCERDKPCHRDCPYADECWTHEEWEDE